MDGAVGVGDAQGRVGGHPRRAHRVEGLQAERARRRVRGLEVGDSAGLDHGIPRICEYTSVAPAAKKISAARAIPKVSLRPSSGVSR